MGKNKDIVSLNQEMADVKLKRGKFKCHGMESRDTDIANNRHFYLKSSSVRSVRLRLKYICFILYGYFWELPWRKRKKERRS